VAALLTRDFARIFSGGVLLSDNYGMGPQISEALVVRGEFGSQEAGEVEGEKIDQSQEIV
jgi:hypothetical protein